jgi:predicted amidophosphoribosyltransferase
VFARCASDSQSSALEGPATQVIPVPLSREAMMRENWDQAPQLSAIRVARVA